jgi:hypothetical protein
MSHVSALLVLREINEELNKIVTPERVEVISSLHPSLFRKGEQMLEGVITPAEYLGLVDAAAHAALQRVNPEHWLAVIDAKIESAHQ